MRYFHSTSHENAYKIVQGQVMRKSKFKVFNYLNDIMIQMLNASDEEFLLDELPTRTPTSYVYTLGEGFYFYNNIEDALRHRENASIIYSEVLDTAKELKLHKSSEMLLEFLEDTFRIFINKTFKEEKDKKVYHHILDLLELAIYDEFQNSPHAAAVLIDTFQHFTAYKEYDIFSNKVPKCYSDVITKVEESVVKSLDVITSFHICEYNEKGDLI